MTLRLLILLILLLLSLFLKFEDIMSLRYYILLIGVDSCLGTAYINFYVTLASILTSEGFLGSYLTWFMLDFFLRL